MNKQSDAETLAMLSDGAADQYAWLLLGHAIAYQRGEQPVHSLVDAAFALEKAQRAIRDAILARHATPAMTR